MTTEKYSIKDLLESKRAKDSRWKRSFWQEIDWRVPVLAILPALVVVRMGTPFMGVATFAYGLMLGGLILRRKRKSHIFFMLSAICLDLSLVMVLELQRNAIATAMKNSLTPLQQSHVIASSIATFLYFGVLFFGVRRILGHGGKKGRSWHLRFGVLAFVFRTLGFILMFSLLSKSN